MLSISIISTGRHLLLKKGSQDAWKVVSDQDTNISHLHTASNFGHQELMFIITPIHYCSCKEFSPDLGPGRILQEIWARVLSGRWTLYRELSTFNEYLFHK